MASLFGVPKPLRFGVGGCAMVGNMESRTCQPGFAP